MLAHLRPFPPCPCGASEVQVRRCVEAVRKRRLGDAILRREREAKDAALLEVFELVDVDSSGEIEREECLFMGNLLGMGAEHATLEFEVLLKKADADGSTSVDRAEWLAALLDRGPLGDAPASLVREYVEAWKASLVQALVEQHQKGELRDRRRLIEHPERFGGVSEPLGGPE